MPLPNEPRGFAVDTRSAIIHKRHAPDAAGLRRTPPSGVANLLGGREPELCPSCFPPPPAPPKPRKARKEPEPVVIEEPEPEWTEHDEIDLDGE